jgi:hypothetical protein
VAFFSIDGMSKLRKNYRFEIFALVVIVIGVLLLVDVGLIIEVVLATLGTATTKVSPTVWLGLILIGGGLLFLAYRMRVRFLRSARWRAKTCPHCGEQLSRVHRRWSDHLLSKTILPHARRYRCNNAACRWIGLRHASHHSSDV